MTQYPNDRNTKCCNMQMSQLYRLLRHLVNPSLITGSIRPDYRETTVALTEIIGNFGCTSRGLGKLRLNEDVGIQENDKGCGIGRCVGYEMDVNLALARYADCIHNGNPASP